MKWVDKHHEFDARAEEIIGKYCDRFLGYILGAGVAGKELLLVLK